MKPTDRPHTQGRHDKKLRGAIAKVPSTNYFGGFPSQQLNELDL